MEHVLKNELLYKAGEIEIYKTYNKEEDSYGLYWTSPDGYRRSEYHYTLIHPFENQRAAALRFVGGIEWVWMWIDTDLNESEMDDLSRVIWEVLRVGDSRCNCNGTDEMFGCDLCVLGKIENSYNFKTIFNDAFQKVFTYDTEEVCYTIKLTVCEDNQSMTFDYMWEQEEVENRVKGIINTYEEQIYELEEHLMVCVVIHCEDSPAVRLVPCTVSIDIVSVATYLQVDNTNKVLKFNDFKNSNGKAL
ncbi:hypothetical protein GCM10027443_17980 [Pontibacter brevis]